MRIARLRFDAALILLCTGLLAGCGGGAGGGQTAAATLLPPALGTPAPTADAPVGYLQNSNALTTSGTIIAGSHQALVAIMSGSTSGTFANDMLTVSTPSVTTSSSLARSASRIVVRPAHLARVEAFAADDRKLLERLQQQRRPSAGAPLRSTQNALPQTLSVGSTASIWVQKGTLSGTRVNVQVPASIVAQTTHANIWVDSTLRFSQSEIAQIAADTENAYASDTMHFALPDYPSNAPGLQARYSACSPGGGSQGTTAGYIQEPADQRIDVMVVNSSNLGGLGGYFSAANLMTQSALNCLNGSTTTYESNQAPFIFVGWFPDSGATYELQEDLVRSTAHELQHLINFVNHAILAPGAASSSFNGNEATYVNEGLSMLAQDLAVETMYGSRGVQFDADDALARASLYLSTPQNYSLSAFTGADPVSWGGSGNPQYNCGGGCYGVAYLFERYLRDRFGGDAYTHAMETSGVTGDANLQKTTGENAPSLFGDFALAMAASSLHVNSSDARFKFGSLDVTAAYPDQFGGSTALGGVAARPFDGASLDVSAPLGGFAFVSMGSVPSNGTAVTVSDHATASGFSLEGGLAQK